MFEAGLLGTLEDIGYSIRNNAFIATHPEIWESNMRRSTGDCSAASKGVRAVKIGESTAKLLEEKSTNAGMNEAEYLRFLISQKPNDYPEIRKLIKELPLERRVTEPTVLGASGAHGRQP